MTLTVVGVLKPEMIEGSYSVSHGIYAELHLYTYTFIFLHVPVSQLVTATQWVRREVVCVTL